MATKKTLHSAAVMLGKEGGKEAVKQKAGIHSPGYKAKVKAKRAATRSSGPLKVRKGKAAPKRKPAAKKPATKKKATAKKKPAAKKKAVARKKAPAKKVAAKKTVAKKKVPAVKYRSRPKKAKQLNIFG